MARPLLSKEAARYTSGGGREHCSLCRHFSPRRGGLCARVLGGVSPGGWCKLFSREIRAMVPDASSFNGGGGGAPALSLDFMTPGTLDPRITFTRASATATYFDSAGTMQTAATNAPRWDNDPATLALRGLLIEEARTNVLLHSSAFNNAAWSKINCSLAAGITGPDGTVASVGVIPGNGLIAHLDQSFAVVSGTTYTLSVFAKAGSQSSVVMFMPAAWWADALQRTATFNLITGVVSGLIGSGVSGISTPVGGGWYRISITATPTLSASGSVQITRAVVTGDGVNTAYYVWGAQLEAGAFATSYIVTAGTSAMRAADVASIATAPWLVPATGTVATDFMLANRTTPDQTLFDMAGSTATVRHRVAGGSGWVIRAAIGAVGFNTANAVASQNIVAKAALAWGGTTGASVLNGGTVATAAISTDAAGATAMTVGSAVGAGYLNGWLRQTRYWNRALTNAELQTVTT